MKKKTYQKPQILFDSFSLSSSIAGDCELKTDTHGAGSCGITLGNMTVFLASVEGCLPPLGVPVSVDDGDFNGICYHVPVDTLNVFNS